jgi:hypothetical protein|tara:strand:- start:341 stop:610 length:270 start_codon:yes stop_codon:yes gene_type:complete
MDEEEPTTVLRTDDDRQSLYDEFLSENDSFRNFALEFGTTYIDEKRLRGLDKEMKDELKELFQGPQANPFIIHNKELLGRGIFRIGWKP